MITRTFNMDMVNSILTHPDIWKDIAPIGVDPFDSPYKADVLYYLVNDGDGIITFHRFREGLKIHPNILPSKRGKHAYQAIEEAIKLMFDFGWHSIYAEIDPRLRNVTMAAKHLGFRLLESGDRNLFVRRKLNS